ncbi:MAG: Crp/Fnr family transcriptional regulator [Flavobacteriales bacterium]|nr:Crp/Fnr family transcriptional regulator [Flavobacteriales bacterium]
MSELAQIMNALPGVPGKMAEDMYQAGRVVHVDEGAVVLREGAYVKELPILLEGTLRVFIGHDDKELLLYFIEPSDSCVMSFAAMMDHSASRVNAVAETPSKLLLVPEPDMRRMLREHPVMNEMLFTQYGRRYMDMLRTVEQVAFGDLPTRLLDHLRKLQEINEGAFLDVRHAKLAQELGTAREVVTRTLKKLEQEGRIKRSAEGIKVIG